MQNPRRKLSPELAERLISEFGQGESELERVILLEEVVALCAYSLSVYRGYSYETVLLDKLRFAIYDRRAELALGTRPKAAPPSPTEQR